MRFFCVLGVLFGLASGSFALEREAFTFTKYDLDVRLEPEQQRLAVRGKITLRNDSASPQKTAALQISSTLDWRSIQVAGKALQFVSQVYQSDIDHTGALSEAIVSLPQEVPPKGSVEIDIGYEGIVPRDSTRLTRIGVPETVAKHLSWDGMSKAFTAVRGLGYVAWYPVAIEAVSLSEGNSVAQARDRWKSREATAEMRVSLTRIANEPDDGVDILCNGTGNTVYEQSKQGQRVKAECVFAPLSLDIPWFVVAKYETLDRPHVTVHYLAGDKAAADDYALASGLAAGLVTDWFGEQREKAEVAELTDADASPFESGSWFLTPLSGTDSRAYRLAAVHQMTHAAFFSPRPWVYEGLAHFAQALDREQQDGREGALDFLEAHESELVEAEKWASTNKGLGGPLVDTGTEEFYRSKAMFVWWMLRDMLGDEALKKVLASYRADQDKDAKYMMSLIQAQTQKDLQGFFDDWVFNDRGLPDFQVQAAKVQPSTTNSYLTTITVENLGGAGAEVPVIVRMKVGEVTRRLDVRGKATRVIRIETPSQPVEVVVNDGSVPESDVSNNSFKISVDAK